MRYSLIYISVEELLLVANVPAPCRGVLGSLSCDNPTDGTCYNASYAVQPDDSVTFTVSARTPAFTWVALGVSDNQLMVSAATTLAAHSQPRNMIIAN